MRKLRKHKGLKNCVKKVKLKYFQKLKDLNYVNIVTDRRRQSGSHFAQDGLISPKLVSIEP